LLSFLKDDRLPSVAETIYRKIVEQARNPRFYDELGVPDTVDGRFELVTLHTFLVLRRLKPGPPSTSRIGQALFDVMFEDMDLSLREMGAGDMGVGKRIKSMVQAFYGRIASYDAGLSSAGSELEEALSRNVYGTSKPEPEKVLELAEYIRSQAILLSDLNIDDVQSGSFVFAAV
tara:strand:- start:626 stop:1150 length:525 start_codon:yes stop_codon:yes gene_type:complete